MTAYIKNGTIDHLKHLDSEDYSYAIADKPTMFDPTLPTIGNLPKKIIGESYFANFSLVRYEL